MGLPSSANNDLAFPFALLEAAPRSTLFSLLKTLVFLCAHTQSRAVALGVGVAISASTVVAPAHAAIVSGNTSTCTREFTWAETNEFSNGPFNFFDALRNEMEKSLTSDEAREQLNEHQQAAYSGLNDDVPTDKVVAEALAAGYTQDEIDNYLLLIMDSERSEAGVVTTHTLTQDPVDMISSGEANSHLMPVLPAESERSDALKKAIAGIDTKTAAEYAAWSKTVAAADAKAVEFCRKGSIGSSIVDYPNGGVSDMDILSSGQDILMSSDDPSNRVPESVSSKAAIAGPILGVLAIIAAVAGALQLPQAQPIMRQLRSLLGV